MAFIRTGILALFICASALSGQQPRKLELVKEFVLDADKEDFSRVIWAMFEKGGGFVMGAPKGTDQLRVYSAAGKLTATFGRLGQGPGELGATALAHGLVGDTLWVGERNTRKLVFFTADHKFARQARYPEETTTSPSSREPISTWQSTAPLSIHPNGDMIFYSGGIYFSGPNAITGLMRLKPDATLIKRLAALPEANPARCNHLPTVPGGPSSVAVPFCTYNFFVRHSGDGTTIAIIAQTADRAPGVASTYRVVVMNDRGDTTFARSLPYRPSAVSKRVRDSILTAKPYLKGATIPSSYPPIKQFLVGDDKRIWIAIEGGELGPGAGQEWLVLDPKGNPVGTATLPPRSNILAANATHLIVSQLDADDLPSVVKYIVK